MRFSFGLIGLLLALAIVGVLVKKQMSAMRVSAPPALSAPADGASAPQNVRQQSQQIQQQFKQQLDAAMQQAPQRAEPEAD